MCRGLCSQLQPPVSEIEFADKLVELQGISQMYAGFLCKGVINVEQRLAREAEAHASLHGHPAVAAEQVSNAILLQTQVRVHVLNMKL